MQNKNTIPFKHWSHKVGRADPVTGVVPPIYSEIVVAVDDLHQSISNLILTPLGSVPTEPEKGCDLLPYIDRHADIAIPNVTRVVWDALTMWEPRIVLQEVKVVQVGEAHFACNIYWRPSESVLDDLRVTEVSVGTSVDRRVA